MLTGNYKHLYDILEQKIDNKRLLHNYIHTLAYGTDAGFYRLVPKLVVKAKDEDEVVFVLKNCSELGLPVTFRAAGTSLSGQAITDSVLLIAGNHWKKYSIDREGLQIKLQPGVIGAKANAVLAPYGRKIGPDPASINAAMIGGIAANNASGMCCGTAQNSYNTLQSMRIVFADGTLLDTSDSESVSQFKQTHATFIAEIEKLVDDVKANPALAERIARKFKIKNTTGYSLNALIDFDDPIEVLQHIMIGSEGTLGFISEITYKTVVEHPHKASALMIFKNTEDACNAVIRLKSAPVSAVELMDRAGLRSVENEAGMPSYLKTISLDACAILVETRAATSNEISVQISQILDAISTIKPEIPIEFTDVPVEYTQLWNIRKGLFPSVGAVRKAGTTVIIEDVAFPITRLAEATLDLQSLFAKWEYSEAVIFGHALEGNLHFVFTQDFSSEKEIARYKGLMDDVTEMVVTKYDGSLKAEHGTGRNMAPFVELEWGSEAYELMKRIKHIFDPKNIINPGVILNDDKNVHLKNLKPLPVANEKIDKCIECGFCEPNCVSADLTLSPRQRIVVYREMARLASTGTEPHVAASLAAKFTYEGNNTCATDGLCATSCPVKIDTGKLVKQLRTEDIGEKQKLANLLARNMQTVTALSRIGLKTVGVFHAVLGTKTLDFLSGSLSKLSGERIPRWNKYMPIGSGKINTQQKNSFTSDRKVVYFPSCINRSMGVSAEYKSEKQLSETMLELLTKAGIEVIYPQQMDKLCCGMPFLSKGYTDAGMQKSSELEQALLQASENGKYPVLSDMSPCLYTMKENMKGNLKLYEPVSFILEFVLPFVEITPLNETISVFPVCSMKKMGLESGLKQLAEKCAREVIVIESNCCGFAGDRGFLVPELNKHGLRSMKNQLPAHVTKGFSTSRTCEIGLSQHSGVSHKSIVYLVNSVSFPRKQI